ncbi:MAG TPA: hypothetical protein VFO16_16085 [Pseudonocardiaceae bacterium]|nr:hypothetical protein [Pseudonocardiaceae bacterium]
MPAVPASSQPKDRQGIDTGHGLLTPASARKEMTGADIPDACGYLAGKGVFVAGEGSCEEDVELA